MTGYRYAADLEPGDRIEWAGRIITVIENRPGKWYRRGWSRVIDALGAPAPLHYFGDERVRYLGAGPETTP